MFSCSPDDHDVISFITHSITSPSDIVSCSYACNYAQQFYQNCHFSWGCLHSMPVSYQFWKNDKISLEERWCVHPPPHPPSLYLENYTTGTPDWLKRLVYVVNYKQCQMLFIHEVIPEVSLWCTYIHNIKMCDLKSVLKLLNNTISSYKCASFTEEENVWRWNEET